MGARIPVDATMVDEHGVTDATALTPGFAAARQQMLAALGGLARLDPVTHELGRLLNANLQQCRVCLRWRYTDADESLLSEVVDYESSERYTERQKLALRLCELYLRRPGVPDPDLRAALQSEFEPEEIMELLLRQVRYTWNKALVALGFDGP